MKPNWIDTFRGVVHIGDPFACGGECTICGIAFDEPASEHGSDSMKETDLPPTCPECIEHGRELLAILRKQLRRVKTNKKSK